MPKGQRRSFSPDFKAQVVLELLKETKTFAQLASEHGVAVTVLREWKLAALKGLPDLFERRDSVSELKTAHERELAELYAEIGRLTTHVNFLKNQMTWRVVERVDGQPWLEKPITLQDASSTVSPFVILN